VVDRKRGTRGGREGGTRRKMVPSTHRGGLLHWSSFSPVGGVSFVCSGDDGGGEVM
jgi:hypothetical protein